MSGQSQESMTLPRLLSVWSALAIAMVANGAFREVVLRPAVNGTLADFLSAILGAAIIFGGTRFLLRPLRGRSARELARASVVLVVLTVMFELVFGHYVDDKSWTELLANYAIWRGRLWPALLLLLGLTPFIWGRWLAPTPLIPPPPEDQRGA